MTSWRSRSIPIAVSSFRASALRSRRSSHGPMYEQKKITPKVPKMYVRASATGICLIRRSFSSPARGSDLMASLAVPITGDSVRAPDIMPAA